MILNNREDGFTEISTDQEHVIRLKGSNDRSEIRRITVVSDNVDQWEEVSVADNPPYTEEEYKAEVVRLIRSRYSIDDETAIMRQKNTKPDEFAAYFAFAEQCKAQARENLTGEKE